MSELSNIIRDNQAFILTFILKSRCISISCRGCKIESSDQLNQIQIYNQQIVLHYLLISGGIL